MLQNHPSLASSLSRTLDEEASLPPTNRNPQPVASFPQKNPQPPHNPAQAIIYILGWYFFSMSISIYNKWMFGDGLDFKFPLITTSFHQLCLFVLSSSVLYLNPSLRPPGPRPPQKAKVLDFSAYARQILPCSLASAGDIGVSNVSIMFVTLSLYTMLKTSSLVFVLLFGLLFQLEKFNWRLVVIVLVMVVSVSMMVSKSGTEESSSMGVFLVFFASMMSGLRWSFTQLLLKNNHHTPNTMATIFYLSPAMCLILFVLGVFVEGWGNFVSSDIWRVKGFFATIGLIVVPGCLAFMMTLCEFKLLKVSQVVTLSVAGIFKELLTIVFSSIIFGDKLSAVNVLGLLITFADILWYNLFRHGERKEGEKEMEMSTFENIESEDIEGQSSQSQSSQSQSTR